MSDIAMGQQHLGFWGALRSFPAFVGKEVKTWPAWWATQSAFSKYFPAAFCVVYWIGLHLLHGFRGDHLMIITVIMVLSYAGRAARVLLGFLLPLIMTGVFYDSQRFWGDYVRGEIRVSEPYRFDKFFFGIHTADGQVLTPNEWWQLHTSPVLDIITGVAYLIFFTAFTLIAAFFHFYVSRRGTRKYTAEYLSKRTPSLMWSFFWVNMMGYSTYYWFPAAPPWYTAKYGLGPAHLVPASAAGAERFDQLMHTTVFAEMYGRSADVFGAIPSLHVAYPFLAMWFAFRFGTQRVLCTLFYLLMCFSAVYLNHHYLLDILWGSAYSLIAAVLVERYYAKRAPSVSAVDVG